MPGLAKNPEVVCTELEEGAVLLSMQTKHYYSLNHTGLAIWRLIETASEPQRLTKALGRTFELDEAQFSTSIQTFVQKLQDEKLVTQVTQATGGDDAETHPSSGDGDIPTTPFIEPQIIKHDQPLHEIPLTAFDAQLPLAE